MDFKNSEIVMLVTENAALFEQYDEVYLFGSVLDENRIFNDVDILLIYSERSDIVAETINRILAALEDLLCIAVDLTILSVDEEQDMQFLNRITPHYLRIK